MCMCVDGCVVVCACVSSLRRVHRWPVVLPGSAPSRDVERLPKTHQQFMYIHIFMYVNGKRKTTALRESPHPNLGHSLLHIMSYLCAPYAYVDFYVHACMHID